MKNWFTSLHAAIMLSTMALLTELWRAFLDAMFVLPTDFGDEGLMRLAALIFTALFAAWAGSLIAAWQGSRWGLIATAILNGLVLIAVPVGWLFFYCPAECRAQAGIFNLANTLNLLFGLLAAVALGLQFRPGQNPKVVNTGETYAKSN
jgi:hypothetical protein